MDKKITQRIDGLRDRIAEHKGYIDEHIKEIELLQDGKMLTHHKLYVLLTTIDTDTTTGVGISYEVKEGKYKEAKEKLLLDAVRAAVGTAALDKLKETPLGQLASAVAVEAAPLATRAFDALGPAFDSIVATAADVIVEHDLNEDTLASFFLPLAKLLRLPANESAPGLGDKLWSGMPHPLSSAAASQQALPTAVVAALETIDEPALRTRAGKLALAALRSASSPLEAEGQEAEGSGADSWQTQAGKWFASAISTPLGELLERAAYMFEVQLSKSCEEIPLAPTEQQLREAVDAAAASVRADMMSDAASAKQVAVLDAFRRLLGVVGLLYLQYWTQAAG